TAAVLTSTENICEVDLFEFKHSAMYISRCSFPMKHFIVHYRYKPH
ncbi:hypothetical protein KGM_211836B, partial [Danaus plexippus plexippus]